MKDNDYPKRILDLLNELSLSDERIEWFEDVAWNLARVTRKYDRTSVYNGLPFKEYLLLSYLEIEEINKWNEEIKFENEILERKLKSIRSFEKKEVQDSISYPFPIGEA